MGNKQSRNDKSNVNNLHNLHNLNNLHNQCVNTPQNIPHSTAEGTTGENSVSNNPQLSLRSALVEVQSSQSPRSANDPLQSTLDQIYTPRNALSLMTTDPDSIPNIICKDIPIQVYVYDVHDGDTVHFLMTGGPDIGPAIKLSLRLLGIDTPELRGGAGHFAEEKIAAEMARDRLAELIGAKVSKSAAQKPRKAALTTIIIRDWDKFGGRVLGDITLSDGKSAVDIMIAEGYGKPYHGEKKTPWTMEDLSKPPFRLI